MSRSISHVLPSLAHKGPETDAVPGHGTIFHPFDDEKGISDLKPDIELL